MNFDKENRGITLIEVTVVIGIFILILSFGVVVDLNSFKSDNFKTEKSKIISILEKTRSRSMANMFNLAHGFCYSFPNYIIFRERTKCLPTSNTDDTIPANTNVASNGSTKIPTFIFDRLTGNTTTDTIHITDGIELADITINNEGTINW